jgi:ABC-2 type transport system permease protein
MKLLAKYWTIFVLCLSERFAYRTDFLLGTLMRFMPIVTTIFLWTAIFNGSSKEEIAGLTRDGMVAYYLLVMVSRAFSSMPGLTNGIALDVRDGNIKKYLIQPVNMIGFLLTMRVAHKVVYYSIAAGPFILVFYLCRDYLPALPRAEVLAAYAISLILAFVIGFLFETFIGLLSFWMLEVSSFSFIVMTLNYVLSGHMFPLDIVPGFFGAVLRFLPFQYLAYFPAKLYLHGSQWTNAQLLAALGEQAACAAVLFILVQFTFRRGLYRYSAFGG